MDFLLLLAARKSKLRSGPLTMCISDHIFEVQCGGDTAWTLLTRQALRMAWHFLGRAGVLKLSMHVGS
jgi:hypothetical protein